MKTSPQQQRMGAASQPPSVRCASDLASNTGAAPEPPVLFQPFEWLRSDQVASRIPSDGAVELIGRALDVSNGVGLVLRMLEQVAHDSESADEDGNPRPALLNPVSVGQLLRLGIAASDLLVLNIERYHGVLREYHPPAGAAR